MGFVELFGAQIQRFNVFLKRRDALEQEVGRDVGNCCLRFFQLTLDPDVDHLGRGGNSSAIAGGLIDGGVCGGGGGGGVVALIVLEK